MHSRVTHLLASVFLAASILAITSNVNAQVATWNLNGTLNSDNPVPVSATAANASAGSLRKSPALVARNFANAFVAGGWPLAGAPDLTRYFEFSVSAGSGYRIVYDYVDFSLYNNFTGSSSWEIRSAEDGFATALDQGSVANVVQPGGTVLADVSALGARAGSVTFRVYTYGNTGTTDPDQRGFRGSGAGGRDLRVFGVVQVVPPIADALATWTLNGTLNSANPLSVSATAPNVTAGSLSKAPALVAENFANAFAASGWPLTGTPDPARYFEFSLSPVSGKQIDYDMVEFSLYNNFDGTSQWEIRSGEDGFTSPLDQGYESVIVGSGVPVRADVSALGVREGSVTFRVYTYANTGVTEPDQRGFRGSGTGGVDLRVFGSVLNAPLTSALATWALNGTLNSANSVPVSATAPDVTAGSLSKSPVLAARSFANAFVAGGWPLSAMPDPARYFEFSVSAEPGFEITYDKVEFSLYNNFDGTSQWEIRSGEDGFTSALDSGYEAQIVGAGRRVSADVSALVDREGSVTFRVYTFSNTGTTDSDQRGFRGSGTGGVDLKVYGTVRAAVPVTNALATWILNGTLNSASAVNVSSTAANVTAGGLSKSTALAARNFSNAFAAGGWPLAGTPDPDLYFEFSVSAASGYEITYDDVLFSLYNNFDGTSQWEIRSGEDGFLSPLDQGYESIIVGAGRAVRADVSALGTRRGTVTFRVYTYANTGTTDPDQRGFRGSGTGGEDLRVFGIVTALPARIALATWTLNGSLSSANPLPVSLTAPEVTAGSLSKSAALAARNFANAYVAGGWPLTGAPDLTRYFDFSVSATSGFGVQYDEVEFSLYNNFGGTSQWEIRSDQDGFANPIDQGYESQLAGAGTAVRADISALTIHQGTVTFRVYTYANTGTTDPDQRGFRGSAAGAVDLRVLGTVHGVSGVPDVAGGSGFRLDPIRPNPVIDAAMIRYSLPASEHVELAIFDVQGRLVRTLWRGDQPAGEHSISWEGRTRDGRRAVPGVYYSVLRAGAARVARSMIVLR